ncbi:MAG TPA: TetR/AcrR family transcriptional regulator C-terminal domain-containing protein [Caulobacteraceae bacterium]|jgi:TetR/AcrR family tetracycline transcriptional repressor
MADVSPGPRRPRRPLLTLEAIVAAAAQVLARHGYAGLTMRAIADELGVRAPALYWYVPGKEALEVQLYDHLMAGFSVSLTGEDWREQVRQAARQLHGYMRGVRDISRLVPHGVSLGPNTLAQLEGGLGILLSGGLSPRDAAYGFNALFAYVLNWVEAEAAWRERQAAGGPAAAAPVFDPADYPSLAIAGPPFFADDPDGRFEFGLDVMIAGLQTRVGG